MAVATVTVKPAAGPLTAMDDPEIHETIIPATIPETTPDAMGASEANAMPRQSGNATRKTTKPAGMSFDAYFKDLETEEAIMEAGISAKRDR